MDVENVISQYRDNFEVYERFTIKVHNLLVELVRAHCINSSVEQRTKEVDHLREKITRAGKSYTDPLSEITDLCGIRIIVRQLADVARVIEIIKNEFEVDDKNSVYKAEQLNVDQFGYSSVHLVVNLHARRIRLTEWKLFEVLKVEIQIRTILQHAWAAISHPFDYQVRGDIPREFRRRLFRLSALFELADEELDQLVGNIREKITDYHTSLNIGHTRIELNVDSLRAYMETASEFQYLLACIRNAVGHPIDDWGDISKGVSVAKMCGLHSIDDVKQSMESTRPWAEEFFSEYIRNIAKFYHLPKAKVGITITGVLGSLAIAAHAEHLTAQEISDGGMNSLYILEIASKARGLIRD